MAKTRDQLSAALDKIAKGAVAVCRGYEVDELLVETIKDELRKRRDRALETVRGWQDTDLVEALGILAEKLDGTRYDTADDLAPEPPPDLDEPTWAPPKALGTKKKGKGRR
jgi:hypothetical protein